MKWLFALGALGIALAVIAGMPPEVGALAVAAVVQSSYVARQREAFAGMIADMTTADTDTRIVENSNGVPFGRAVGRGVADRGCILGAGAVTQFLGISVRDMTLAPQASDSDYVDEYQRYNLAGILFRGDIWVETGGAVGDGDDVTFNSLTGVLSSTATSGTQFAIAGARWMTSAGSGGLAIVRLSGSLPVS